MKKWTYSLVLVAVLSFFALPQAKAQAVEEGDIIVEGFYGWPNFTTFLLRAAYSLSNSDETVDIGGFGPAGGRVEYLLDDHVGIGLEVYYGSSSIRWEEANISGNGPDQYFYDVDFKRLTANLRAAYHFDLGDSFDGYVAGGVGYRYTRTQFDSNDELFVEQNVGGLLPFSVRGAVGGRYYIANTIGLGLEFALGGPLVSGGVSIKL